MKVYLLVYSNELGTGEQVRNVLDMNPLVRTWRTDLPNCFYVVSEASAVDLAESIRAGCPDSNARLLVTEISTNYWGWLHSEAWHMIQHKVAMPIPLPPPPPSASSSLPALDVLRTYPWSRKY